MCELAGEATLCRRAREQCSSTLGLRIVRCAPPPPPAVVVPTALLPRHAWISFPHVSLTFVFFSPFQIFDAMCIVFECSSSLATVSRYMHGFFDLLWL